MIRLTAIVCFAFFVTGCATQVPSVPAEYTGPMARLDDSAKTYSKSKADFFVAEQVNGGTIDNSLNETFRRNQGRGMSMTPYFVNRSLIAEKPLKVTIKGRTHYAAPVQTLTKTVYQVKGEVEFTPKADARYIVRGELGENYSAVWIEDAESNEVVGQKIEVNGSAKLGVLDK